MTTNAFSPAPNYTISGTGPYDIPFFYDVSTDVVATILIDGQVQVQLLPSDYTVVPEGPTTSGTLFLTSAASILYDGETLVVTRETTVDQVWQGLGSTAIELEAQLDELTRAVQDNAAVISSKLQPSGIWRTNAAETLADNKLEYTTGLPTTVEVGQTIRTLTEGYAYAVAPSTATDHDATTANGVKLYVLPGPNGYVTPEQFGAKGDGTNENAIMEAVANWGRKNSGLKLNLTAGKTYGYTNSRFLCGIPNQLIIDGHGAALQNRYVSEGGTSSYNIDRECLAFPTCWYALDNEIYPGGVFVDYDDGSVIAADIATGDTTFTVATGEGANFTVGERALLYGFYAQTTAFPVTCRVFEYVTVAGVTGDTITVSGPISNNYDIRWPATGTGPTWGPPRAISLSRSNFQETPIMEFNAVHFKADPAWADARSGRVWIGNYGTATLNLCRGDAGMYIMQGQHFVDNGSTFVGDVEIDKFIDSVILNGVDYASISQGSGAKRIVHNDTNIRTVLNVTALESVQFNGGGIVASTSGLAAIPDTFGCGSVRFDNTVLFTSPTNTSLFGLASYSASFTEDSYDTGTGYLTLSIPLADWITSKMYRAVRVGSQLTDVSGKPVFRLRAMPHQDGSNLKLVGEKLDAKSVSPVTLYLAGTTQIDARRLRQTGAKILYEPVVTPFYAGWGGVFLSSELSSTEFRVSNKQIPEPGIANAVSLVGYPLRATEIVVDITKAYAGATTGVYLKIEVIDPATSSVIKVGDFDLRQVGRRVLTASGVVGSVGIDSITGLPSIAVPKVSVRTNKTLSYLTSSDRAEWAVTMRGYRQD